MKTNHVLRLLEEHDLPLTLAWRNQEHIRRWFFTEEPISYKKHRAWFNKYKKLDTDFVFIILSKKLHLKPVGQVSLYAIDWKTMIGEFGRLMIGESEARGLGLARSASLLLLHVGFDILGLKKIILEVKEDNIAAISLYLSIGFLETVAENGIIKMEIQYDHLKIE